MSVATKKRKKFFQIAKELNLATETIQEFLEKKGIKVSNPNMRISEDVYDLIIQRFSFEKKEAEKIHKRREERTRDEIEVSEQTAEISAEEPEEEEITAEGSEEIEEKEIEEETAEEGVGKEQEITEEAEDVEEEDVAEKTSEEKEVEKAAAEKTEEMEIEEEEEITEDEPATAEETEEEEDTESPRVGDIIDHPMTRQYQERLQQEEALKKERQKKTLEKLKKGKETQKQKRKKTSRPKKEAPEMPKEKKPEIDLPLEIELEEELRKEKKAKKKDRLDTQEEKDARRRKAFEMLRRESKKIRPQMVVPEEEEEGSPVVRKEKEGRRKRQKKKKEVDQKEVDSALKKTLAEMRDSGTGKKKRKKAKSHEGEEVGELKTVKVTEFITTQDLANLLDVPPSEIIRKCLELGLVVTINQRLDMDTIKLLAEEFGFQVEEEEEFGSEFLEDTSQEEDKAEDLDSRAPVVTIMGHVDHGKTSLLDYIRHANVVAGESGGITQHIGAYEVQLEDGRRITFLDTPGHEAFTAMRARGAQVTDIVVLVIAADDRVMPQTEEALDHAKAAGVSIVIAINKVDKPNADPQAIRKQLAERNILVEDWGGSYQCVEVSAKTGEKVQELLETILLEAELLDLKANPKKQARGVVLEAFLDKGKGPVATVLVEEGTLDVGDSFVVGQHSGRVRALLNERGQRVDNASPSTPVQVLGLDGIPEAGDRFIVMADDKAVREISYRRQQLKREQDFRQVRLLTLDELSQKIKTGDVKELKILVKADVDGSAQAITDSLLRISSQSVEVHVIRRSVGPISESDVILAAASQAIIIGFNVRPTVKAKELADRENVDIRLYKVIYDAIEDVQKALEGMLEPIEREVVLGTAEVREVFKISRLGTIAGCHVLNGKITRNAHVRLVRNDVEIYDGKLASLKRFKDDVREVQSGYECGLNIENFNDIKEGDLIEAYEIVMEAQTLDRSMSK